MRKFILLILGFFFAFISYSQSGDSCYVYSESLSLRNSASVKSKVILRLSKYDNLKVIEKDSTSWTKVSYNGIKGFVFSRYIKPGKAYITSYSVRTGAKCRDGSNSSATGRGACSHHGGVSYWLTQKRQSVRIEN